MTSPQREALGQKRALLTKAREVAHEKWLAHVAYLLQSYYKQYFNEMQRNPDTAGKVIDSFIKDFESKKEQNKAQMNTIDIQINALTQQIEYLAGRGM